MRNLYNRPFCICEQEALYYRLTSFTWSVKQGTRKTRPCLSGHFVYNVDDIQPDCELHLVVGLGRQVHVDVPLRLS